MRVWLLTVGEPLPIDDGVARLFRAGMLANELAARGHEIVWWTSTFDHFRRRHRFANDATVDWNGYQLKLLHGPAYRASVSLARIRNHAAVARSFSKLAPAEERPDVILCSMPTIELSVAATRYAKPRRIPVVLDIRDLWPDIIVDHAPAGTRWLAGRLLGSMFRDLREACRDATALSAITDGCLEWGLDYAGRGWGELDRAFPLAYKATAPPADAVAKATAFWSDRGVGVDESDFTVCFFGPISRRYEIRDVIAAARILHAERPRCRFVICGTGEDLSACQRLAAGLGNVVFPGWVGATEIWTLLRRSKVGLVPHPSTRDYVLSLPNKAIECLSGGLPVITSLSGTLQQLLEREQCGARYPNGDVQALAAAIRELHDNPARCRAMANHSAELFRRQFTAERVYGDMCRYLQLIASQPPMLAAA